MLFFLEKLIKKLEGEGFFLKNWLLSFLALVSLRVFLEEVLTGLKKGELFDFLAFWGHTTFFFLFSFLLFLFLLKGLTKEGFGKIANFLLWGFGIILFPPILDKLFFQEEFFWSFYLFADLPGLLKNFFLFFGEKLRIGITFGVRVEIVLAVLGLSFYVFLKKKQKKWFFLSLFLFYGVFYLLGSFPSWLALVFEILSFKKPFGFFENDIVAYFLTPFSFFGLGRKEGGSLLAWKMTLVYHLLVVFSLVFLQFKLNRKKFWALLKNVRYPQMTFNSGLLGLGLGLGWFFYPENLTKDIFSWLGVVNLWIAVFSAWFFSVLVNDEEDLLTDQITNPGRPLPQKVFSLEEYRQYHWIFFFFSVFFPLLLSWKLFFLFLIYHSLTFLYSCPPFRLKRFLLVASFLSSFASLLFLTAGFLFFSSNQTLAFFPWSFSGFLFLSYFLVIPLKDLKDIKGDRLVGVWTLPVLLGENKTRLFLASLFLVNYLFSVYVFREEDLFLPALVLGSGTFWLVVEKRIKNHFLPALVLFLVGVYLVFVLKELFK